MGISASSLSNNQNYVYRHIKNPFPNTSQISKGAYGRFPSATALAPSSTAYGTNANPSVGGPVYTSSASVLAQNAITTSNVVTTTSTMASGKELQNAVNTISQQTPAPRFTSSNNVFTTSTTPTQVQQSETNTFSPVKTFTPATTRSAVFESKLAITGQNATITAENAANLAAVNASLNVKVSQQAAQALQALQVVAAAAAQNANITGRVDGMIPVSAAILSDFSSTTSSTASNLKIFDNVTETFNQIMGGGGHGGGGATLGQPHSEEEGSQDPEKKKHMDFMA